MRVLAALRRPQRPVAPAWVAGMACLWMATAANLPLWKALAGLGVFDQPAGWALGAALAVMIAAAQGRRQLLRHGDQQLVPRLMTVGIVDLLETVEIDKGDEHRVSGPI